MSTLRTVLLGAGAAPLLFATAHAQIDDSIRGVPSEANHFIETPDGWAHPMTLWGERSTSRSAGAAVAGCA